MSFPVSSLARLPVTGTWLLVETPAKISTSIDATSSVFFANSGLNKHKTTWDLVTSQERSGFRFGQKRFTCSSLVKICIHGKCFKYNPQAV